MKTRVVQARFLLGPAGSGKTHRCLAEIRAELLASPDGSPLILLAPKQATFQLERQLLADPGLVGYTRLRILSFERLAQFVLDELHVAPPAMLSEQGRVMVLRALLIQHQKELKIFHASARLNGFAQQLSVLLREFQHHRLSVDKLLSLAANSDAPAQLRDKLHDLALLLAAYNQWLKTRALCDANSLLDVAVDALKVPSSKFQVPGCGLCISRVWLDGFAEMTPQELDLLAAFLPLSESATLAFCLEREPEGEQSWLSTWSVVAQTFRRCHARIAALEDCVATVETLENKSAPGRFARSEILADVEANWSKPPTSESSEVCDPTTQIRIAICHDPESEAVLAAREILRHVRAGGRFRDCGVILRSLDAYHATLDRVFRRYDIPFFMDRRKAAAHHPLAELTRYALRTVAYDWRHDDWFGALKSGLVVANEGAIDQLENDALANGWEGKTWREPLPVEHLEKIRQFIMPPFNRFAVAISGNVLTGKRLAEAVAVLWRDLEVESQLDRWSDATRGSSGLHIPSSAFHQGVLEQMRDVLGNLARAFPDAGLSLHEWLPVFEAGLSGLTVGVIPPALDQVLIGAIDRSRNPDLKLALVLGLNEGVFPAPPVPGTLLTETDRAGLERADVYLGPTPRQRIGHERYFGYIACTRASERLVLTCAAEDGKGKALNPSPFVAHVCRIAGAKEEIFNAAGQWWKGEHASEIAAPLLKMRADVAGLTELPAIRPVVEKWRQVEAAAVVSLPPAAVDLLFGTNLNTSVSALEDFAACPFRFFVARGLRLQERMEFEVDDRDRGNFHHDVLEEFHRRATMNSGRWRDLGVKVAVELVGQIAREDLPIAARGKFQSDGAARFTGGILIERIQKLVAALIEWMPQYDFDPVGSEIAFEDGTQGALPAWKLDLGNGHSLSLRGRIDRVDLCRLPDGDALAVVMDYKSRVRRLDNTKLHHGLELQLLSYLGVLKQVGDLEKFPGVKTLRPAGVFYIPLNGGAGKTGTKRTDIVKAHEVGGDSGAAAKGRATYRHSGRFLADELTHFDNRNGNKGDQFVFKKKVDGTLAATGNEALSLAEFDALRTKVEEHLRDYGRRIFEGEVAVSPFRIGKKTACDYCDFRPVCRFDPWTQLFRQLRPPPKKSADSQDE